MYGSTIPCSPDEEEAFVEDLYSALMASQDGVGAGSPGGAAAAGARASPAPPGVRQEGGSRGSGARAEVVGAGSPAGAGASNVAKTKLPLILEPDSAAAKDNLFGSRRWTRNNGS